jgi:DNA-binding SARP family transcriptional activator
MLAKNVGDAVVRSARASVRVLGGFELAVDLRPVLLPIQAQRVLGYLAVRPSAAQREALAGTLWPDSSETRARSNLRTALWRIRQAGPWVVEATRSWVRISSGVHVDSRRATKLAQDLIERRTPALVTRSALALLEEDLLPGWDEEWLVVERERMRQLRIHALEALSARLRDQGRFGEAIDSAISAVAAEPLRESAQIALIEAYLAEGNVSEAARQKEAYRALLNDELGLEPSERVRTLGTTRLGRSGPEARY